MDGRLMTTLFIQRAVDSGTPGPHVVLIAGVHGDEYEPMLAVSALLERLRDQLLKGKVTGVPVVNESAYARAQRTGEDLLDLARTCPGKEDGSRTEQAAAAVSALIRSADYVVDMHTGGLAHDIFPMAGYMLHTDPGVLGIQREMALACGLPVIWGTDYRPDGRTLSVARDHGIPAIYLEYGGGAGLRKEVMKAYEEGFLRLLVHWGMLTEAPPRPPAEERYWVEDPRPDSGYFQGKMPAPSGGIFVAEAAPGQRIRKGALFGTILDPITGTRTSVRAGEDGFVLSVRVAVRVAPGDALGTILPITAPGKVVLPG